jgi:hypothetical protein
MGRIWNATKLTGPTLGRSNIMEQTRVSTHMLVLALSQHSSYDPPTLARCYVWAIGADRYRLPRNDAFFRQRPETRLAAFGHLRP